MSKGNKPEPRDPERIVSTEDSTGGVDLVDRGHTKDSASSDAFNRTDVRMVAFVRVVLAFWAVVVTYIDPPRSRSAHGSHLSNAAWVLRLQRRDLFSFRSS